MGEQRRLTQVRELLNMGQQEEAQRVVVEALGAKRRGDFVELALLCEEVGRSDDAFLLWLRAAREDDGSPVVLTALAQHHLERGEPSKALALAEQVLAVAPAHLEALTIVATVASDRGDGAALIEKAREAGADEEDLLEVVSLFRSESGGAMPSGEEEDDLAAGVLIADDADVARFMGLFSGREDVYARQWVGRDRAVGWSPVWEPLTVATLRNHLLGNVTLGVYPIRADGRVSLFALDIDITQTALDSAHEDPARAIALREAVAEAGVRCAESIRALGLPVLLENSGYKGRHVWGFFAEPLPASEVHRFGQLLLVHLAELRSADLSFEFFPRQPKRGGGRKLGNLIKLPLGIHRRSGRPSTLLDAEGSTIPAPLSALHGIERAGTEAFRRITAGLEARGYGKILPLDRRTAKDCAGAQEGAPTEILAPWTAEDFERDPTVAHVLARCALLRAVVQEALDHKRLTRDEQLALVHTLGHSEPGARGVNFLLQRLVDVGPDMFLQRPLSGSPASCRKMRQRTSRIREETRCDCVFPFAPDRYPSPALHLLSAPAARRVAAHGADAAVGEAGAPDSGQIVHFPSSQEAEPAEKGAPPESAPRGADDEAGSFFWLQQKNTRELIWLPEGGTPPEGAVPAAMSDVETFNSQQKK